MASLQPLVFFHEPQQYPKKFPVYVVGCTADIFLQTLAYMDNWHSGAVTAICPHRKRLLYCKDMLELKVPLASSLLTKMSRFWSSADHQHGILRSAADGESVLQQQRVRRNIISRYVR